MSDDPEEFARSMEQPATRGELMHLARLTSLAFISQGLANIALVEAGKSEQREAIERAVEHASMILTEMRAMMASWRDPDGND